MEAGGSEAGSGWNRDTVVGVAAALVLVGAMAGVFLYERSQFDEYPVTWETTTSATLEETASLGEGDERSHELAASAAGISHVDATLTWTDDVGDPDSFTLTLEAPNGSTTSDSGDGGEIQLASGVTPAPDVSSVAGRSPDEAREQANGTVDSTKGQGSWTATVSLDEAPGTDQAVGGQEDGANDYNVEVDVEVWEPRIPTR